MSARYRDIFDLMTTFIAVVQTLSVAANNGFTGTFG